MIPYLCTTYTDKESCNCVYQKLFVYCKKNVCQNNGLFGLMVHLKVLIIQDVSYIMRGF